MRCFALLSICLMCALNDSDESKVTPRNLAFFGNWYVCVVDGDVWCGFIGGATFTRKKYMCRLVGI